MARVNNLLTNFTAGELSPRLDARVDINRYRNGLSTLENGIVMPHGGVRRRPGTLHVAEIKNSINPARLVEFQFNTEQVYVLEFGPLYVRFFTNRGQVYSGASPLELTTTYTANEIWDLSFTQSADTLFIAHPNHPLRRIVRTSSLVWVLSAAVVDDGPYRAVNTSTSNTFTLSSISATTTYGTAAPGATMTVTAATAGTFTAGNVGAIYRLQEPAGKASNVFTPVASMTIANNDMITNDSRVYVLTNLTGTTTWESGWPLPTHESGTVRVQTSAAGKYVDITYLHDTTCQIEITGYTSGTVVAATVVGGNHVPASVVSGGTSLWEEGAWSDRRGYPSQITFFESRLWAAGNTAEPQKIWASASGEFENWKDGPDDNDALVYEIASNKVDVINWLSPGKVLAVGTASGEYAVAASNRNEALTPSNVRIVRQTPYGSAKTRPVNVANATIFLQRFGDPDNEGRRIREFTYSFEVDSYVAPDLTIISEHITGAGVDNLAYAQSPDAVIWCCRTDGQLAAVTYEREQEVVGWHRHRLGGTSVDVESLVVVPGVDGDEVWMIVKRDINGTVRRYVEYMHRGLYDEDVVDDAVFVDSALQYAGVSTTTITGLSHLAGQFVDVYGSNGVQRHLLVSTSGQISLPEPVTKATVGLPYTMILETLDLEAGAQQGAARGQRKRISDVWMEVYRSLGGSVGRDSSNMDEIKYRELDDPVSDMSPLKTGLVRVAYNGGWGDTAKVRIEHDDPTPFTVLGIVAEMETSG